MASEKINLQLQIDKNLFNKFKGICSENKADVQEVLIGLCEQYVDAHGVTQLDEEKSKSLDGAPT